MIDVLAIATQNFITHQLREASDKKEDTCSKIKHQSTIDLITSQATLKAYFYYTDEFIQAVSHMMLCEETVEEEALTDLINETTNMIAGSAKIVASDNEGENFDIGIPTYQGRQAPNIDGTLYAFYINNKLALQISVKE